MRAVTQPFYRLTRDVCEVYGLTHACAEVIFTYLTPVRNLTQKMKKMKMKINISNLLNEETFSTSF